MDGLSQLHRLCEIEHDMGAFLLYSSVVGSQLIKKCTVCCSRHSEMVMQEIQSRASIHSTDLVKY